VLAVEQAFVHVDVDDLRAIVDLVARDFHGGGILEWGSHTVDLCHWAADLDHTQPISYEPVGTNVGPYHVNCKYENGVTLTMRDNAWEGALNTGSCSFRIEGDLGWVETGDQTRIECSPNIKPLLRPTESASLALQNHVAEFVQCIKDRRTPSASAANAANSHVTCHAAFIAYQRSKTLNWDTNTHAFTNDDTANNDNSASTAQALGSGVSSRIAKDADWYSLNVNGTANVTLTFDAGSGALDLALTDSAGTTLASGTRFASGMTISRAPEDAISRSKARMLRNVVALPW